MWRFVMLNLLGLVAAIDGPVMSLETLTGPRHLAIRGEDPWTYQSFLLEIPRNAPVHTIEVDLRP